MLQILQTYHARSRVDGPPQVTVAPSFLIILCQKSSSPLQVPISSPYDGPSRRLLHVSNDVKHPWFLTCLLVLVSPPRGAPIVLCH